MIKLLVSCAGTDENGEPFSASAGDVVSMDKKSEENYIAAGYAEAVGQRTVAKKSEKK